MVQKNQKIPRQNPSPTAVRSRACPDFRCNHQKGCQFIPLYSALIYSSKSYSPSQTFGFLPNTNKCNTTNGKSLPLNAACLSPQKRLLSDGQQLQISGSLKIHSLTWRVLWDSGYSPVFSFVLPREAWENSDYSFFSDLVRTKIAFWSLSVYTFAVKLWSGIYFVPRHKLLPFPLQQNIAEERNPWDDDFLCLFFLDFESPPGKKHTASAQRTDFLR